MRMSDCHPDKKHCSHGLCGACYARWKRSTDEGYRKRQLECNKRWNNEHPEYSLEKNRRQRLERPEIHRQANKKYRLLHPDRIREHRNKWRRENPDKYLPQMRTEVKRRKALKKGAKVSDFTEKQWEQLKKDHNYFCYYCNQQSEYLTQDHKIPLSKKGNHTLSNIVPACSACNNKKGTMTDTEFIEKYGKSGITSTNL